MTTTFAIQQLRVPPSERRDEQLGSKKKFWFADGEDRTVLFKCGRENEDWSEKAAEQCAQLLGIPCAAVELAVCDGQRGIVSPSFLAPDEELSHGNELLAEIDRSYPASGGGYKVAAHTVSAIQDALRTFSVRAPTPRGFSRSWPEGFDGFDVFIGYLLLDAWIGNSDRHHENWGAIKSDSGRSLAPSYDHASSLGRNDPIEKVRTRLARTDPRVTVESYVAKNRSALYASKDSTTPMHTREAFLTAGSLRPDARAFWHGRLAAIARSAVEERFDMFPGSIVEPTRTRLAIEILELTRRDLLGVQP